MTSGLAKVILFGEHAVVYGYPALAGAIDRRVSCRIAGRAEALQLSCPTWGLAVCADDDHPVARALTAIAAATAVTAPLRIAVQTTVPKAAGLGSSAALCVALTRALFESRAHVASDAEIERIANLGEAAFHESPSGVDVALALRGGLGVFRKGRGFEPITCAPISIAVALTGRERSTRAMVQAVAQRRAADPTHVDAELAALGQLAETATAQVRKAKLDLAPLMGEAQERLASLGLSCAEIDDLVARARAIGATAKLTGAGGGGAVIGTGPDLDELARTWRSAGYEAFTTEIGARP